MSLRATVLDAVDRAFAAADDLVLLGTLSSKSVETYDFSTRGVVSTESTQTVEVIIETTKRPSGNGFTTTAMLRSGPDLSVYDTLTVSGKVYNIVDFTDDEFTISAILTRDIT